MPFIPNTDENRNEMLKAIGVSDFEELLKPIPEKVRFRGKMNLPTPLSEYEVTLLVKKLSEKNRHAGNYLCFLGGGAYDHFIPAAVNHLISRSEFYTAYTPYQPEVSQGNLQSIYEYQTMIANLTAMDVANASMYDGGSALAEAALMASGETRREEIIISKSVHPFYREVVKTYCYRSGMRVVEVEIKDGTTDLNRLRDGISERTAAVLIQHPNFFGNLEEVEEVESITHKNGALYVVSVDPISLGVLKPPGEYGADIATGEGQCLGNPLNFGGPYLGIFATRKDLIRRMPGRLAGITVDSKGKRGFVLTLQTREQHIRREKATSSICTNEQLCALSSTIYLALMGKEGIPTVSRLCLQKAHYLSELIKNIDGFELLFNKPFFKEFAIKTPVEPAKIIELMKKEKIFAGIDLKRFDYGIGNGLLVAVTEKRTKEEMDHYAEVLSKIG